jgi:hypothetical protein
MKKILSFTALTVFVVSATANAAPLGTWCSALVQGEAFIPANVKVGETLKKYYGNDAKIFTGEDGDGVFDQLYSLTSVKNLTSGEEFQDAVTDGIYGDEADASANNLHPKWDLDHVFAVDKDKIEKAMGMSIDQLKSVDSVQKLIFDGAFSGDCVSNRELTVYRLYHGQEILGAVAYGPFGGGLNVCGSRPN